jgi:hypothetical protein
MSNSKTYPLTKRPQLIDLNGELVNFKLDFLVESQIPTKEFLALVLTQEQLDSVNINKIEMKTAQGKISGNITANNNKYQNYFLVLKKKENDEGEDFNVNVAINIEKLENVEVPSSEPSLTTDTPSTEITTTDNVNCNVPFYKKVWFWVFIGILLFVTGLFIYNYIYLKKPLFWKKSTTEPATQATINNPDSELYKQLSEIAN